MGNQGLHFELKNDFLFKTIKLLEYNIGENLDDLGFGDNFLDT